MSAAAGSPRLGIRWDPRWDPAAVPTVARHVEELGYDELWMIEDCFSAGGLTTSVAALGATERLVVGVGVLPTVARNAAIAAMEIAAVARMFPGRFVPSFGHGVDSWMRQIDARPPRRLTLLQETLSSVRTLLAGERLDVEGAFVKLRDVQLEHPPEVVPPVLVGTTGPRGLEIAGRFADGAVIPEVAAPGAVSWARSLVDAAGRRGQIVVYSYLSLDDDREAALRAARPLVSRWLVSGDFPDMAEQAGLGRDGAGEIDDDLLTSIATAGAPEDGIRTVAGLGAAGADSVVLLPRGGDWQEQIELFAARCLPHFKG
ncbi:MAG: LLM class flavin-dependent oxidoreductase [Actinobacteria bacterium]|nr:LLM class flavin-dependent oxidoreductase [Actinomycetota bacterium]